MLNKMGTYKTKLQTSEIFAIHCLLSCGNEQGTVQTIFVFKPFLFINVYIY